MANYLASFLFNLNYTGPSNEPLTMQPESVNAPYAALNEGIMDIPDGTASSTTFPVPFGTITANATGGIIVNRTGQNLEMKINGAASASHSIPQGGVFAWSNPATTSLPITAIDLTTTAGQVGQGQVAYRLFGDPI